MSHEIEPRPPLFSSQRSRYGNAEQAETIASLQQNVAALTAINRREKAQNEVLKAQIGELASESSRLKGGCARWTSSSLSSSAN